MLNLPLESKIVSNSKLERGVCFNPPFWRGIKLKYFSKTLLNKAIPTSQKVCKSQYSDAQKKENKNVEKVANKNVQKCT